MGRLRTPEALKLIRGTTQPCRKRDEVLTQPVQSVPDPPDWLSGAGAEYWRKITPHLHAVGILRIAGIEPLAVLCATYGAIVDAIRQGDFPPATTLGIYRTMCADFGLTPAHASKVPKLEKPKSATFAPLRSA